MTIYLKMSMGSLSALILLVLLVATSAAAEQPAARNDVAQLRINEYMAVSNRTLADPQEPGTYPDWVELYNAGATDVSLSGLFLTDDAANPTRFAISTSLSIPAGGFLVFYADNDRSQGALHTNFTLSRNGGFIGLYDGATGTMIDSRTFGSQTSDVSEGRDADGSGNWRFFSQPSPGFSNLRFPPVITRVSHVPTTTLSTTPVDVTAVITDDSSILTLTLYYSFTGATSFAAVPMTAAATQGTFVAQIPALPDNTLVFYYIGAQDVQSALDGRTFTSPSLAPINAYHYVIGYQPPPLFVNEAMADNRNIWPNPDRPGRFDDWIEIYNAGNTPVSLEGLYLTDDSNKLRSEWYQIPFGSGLTVPAGGYIIFYADSSPNLGPLHTNFGLNVGGEDVELYGGPQGAVLISGFSFGRLPSNRSYGRSTDGSTDLTIDLCPTPGAANQSCENYGYVPYIAVPKQ